MKNKKFPKLLHRLPVLLLALILAVMPLSMAVPVSAISDVLNSSDTWFAIEGVDVPFPPEAPVGEPRLLVLGDGYFTVYYAIAHNFTVTRFDDRFRISVTNYKSVFSFSELEWSDPVFESYFFVEDQVVGHSLSVLDDSVSFNGLDVAVPSFPFPLRRSVGVLDVFSGVGSWLSGAVQHISTMFWTAESGMTVLGYLAVASLALAVILLIFYLIAGWLKFH